MTIVLFWISLLLLFYSYLGYGFILSLLIGLKSVFRSRRARPGSTENFPITLIITAYNEEDVLQKKIENSLLIRYPPDLFKIIIITDGSTDKSPDIAGRYPAITVLHQKERRGKFAAIKRAMHIVQTPLVLFSDANSMLNPDCAALIVRHYQNPKVGGVAGEKKILHSKKTSAVGEAEGIYWKYESIMKSLEAGFNTVVGAAGELFSIRTTLFKWLDDKLILDDFVISMETCLQGYKIEYEPGAFAVESASASLAEEEKRKVRIAAGAYQSIGYLKKCFNIFRHPLLCFQFISRRVLRWVFCPLMLVMLLISNILLFIHPDAGLFYNGFMYAQITFYVLALIGWVFVRKGNKLGLLTIPFYFVFMNYCMVKGFFKFLKGGQTVLWEKARRQTD